MYKICHGIFNLHLLYKLLLLIKLESQQQQLLRLLALFILHLLQHILNNSINRVRTKTINKMFKLLQLSRIIREGNSSQALHKLQQQSPRLGIRINNLNSKFNYSNNSRNKQDCNRLDKSK